MVLLRVMRVEKEDERQWEVMLARDRASGTPSVVVCVVATDDGDCDIDGSHC